MSAPSTRQPDTYAAQHHIQWLLFVFNCFLGFLLGLEMAFWFTQLLLTPCCKYDGIYVCVCVLYTVEPFMLELITQKITIVKFDSDISSGQAVSDP